jgi:hypothetical protein
MMSAAGGTRSPSAEAASGPGDEHGGGADAATLPQVPPWRAGIEWAARAIAIGAVLWGIGTVWRGDRPHRDTVLVQRDLPSALVTWTTGTPPADLRVVLASAPDASTRAWIAALARAGMRVRWEPNDSATLAGTAVSVEPIPNPAGETRVAVAAPPGTRIALHDAVGPIDTMTATGVGAIFEGPPLIGLSSVLAAGAVARAAPGDSLMLRHLLVLGQAAWEPKFLVRALEEAGWTVDVRLTVAPRAAVRQDVPLALDTAHYAAVIVVGDSGPTSPQALVAYVRAGGGLVLVDRAAPGLPSLAVGAAGSPRDDSSAARAGEASGSEFVPITSLQPGGVPIERRGAQIVVALRRVGAGHVEQIGYRDTWRWRMAGGDSGITMHRRWWVARVADVAYAPRIPLASPVDVDPAPLAAWYGQFGSPTRVSAGMPAPPWSPSLAWLFTTALVALLVEWTSRRIRGAA